MTTGYITRGYIFSPDLEGNGETLRAALNAIATVAPEWLRSWVPLPKA